MAKLDQGQQYVVHDQNGHSRHSSPIKCIFSRAAAASTEFVPSCHFCHSIQLLRPFESRNHYSNDGGLDLSLVFFFSHSRISRIIQPRGDKGEEEEASSSRTRSINRRTDQIKFHLGRRRWRFSRVVIRPSIQTVASCVQQIPIATFGGRERHLGSSSRGSAYFDDERLHTLSIFYKGQSNFLPRHCPLFSFSKT